MAICKKKLLPPLSHCSNEAPPSAPRRPSSQLKELRGTARCASWTRKPLALLLALLLLLLLLLLLQVLLLLLLQVLLLLQALLLRPHPRPHSPRAPPWLPLAWRALAA